MSTQKNQSLPVIFLSLMILGVIWVGNKVNESFITDSDWQILRAQLVERAETVGEQIVNEFLPDFDSEYEETEEVADLIETNATELDFTLQADGSFARTTSGGDGEGEELVEGEEGEVVSLTFYPVVRVVDGDTFRVIIDDVEEVVRVIGIDTPETVRSGTPVECFGVEASNAAKRLLEGARVALHIDAGQDTRDRYGRLLRYATLEDGQDFGTVMITDGYAFEYTYNTPYEKQSLYKNLENTARTTSAGLWGAGCR